MNQRKRKTVVKGSRHENHACAHDHLNDFIFTSIIGKENYRITKSLESLHIMMTPDQWAVQFSQSSTRKKSFWKESDNTWFVQLHFNKLPFTIFKEALSSYEKEFHA